jgi:hypothetical protein
VAAKIRDLREAREKRHALALWVQGRLEEARTAVARAEQHAVPRPYGGPPPTPEWKARADQAVDDAKAERARLEAEQHRIATVTTPLGTLLNGIDRAIAEGRLAGLQGTVVPIPDGGPSDWLAALQETRAALEPLRAERIALETHHVAQAEAEARLDATLAELAEHVECRAFCARFLAPDDPGGRFGAIPWESPPAHRLAYGTPNGVTARAVVSLLLQTTGIKKLLATTLETLYQERGPGLTEAERAAKLAALDARHRDLETQEEILVLALERAHVECPRRPEADPLIVATVTLAEAATAAVA